MAINANTQIYDNAVDRAAMIRLFEKRVNNKIELVIDGHVVRTDKLIRQAKLSKRGFLRLREAIDVELSKTYTEAFRTSKASLLDLASDQVSFAAQNIEATAGKIWRVKKPQRRVAEEFVLKKPLYNNRTLKEGWNGVSLGEKKRLESVIRRGIANGDTPDSIALAVRKGNIHKISRNQSRALVVTSITSVHAQADHAVYEANEKSLRGWQYVATLDARTTPICTHRDGSIYPVGDTSHLPPAHYNCRSVSVPVMKSWDDLGSLEGIAQVRQRNLKGLTKKQIAFYDGQTPLRETYHQWLLRQTPEKQLRHLGDFQKLELFRTGQLHLSKFTNDVGRSLGIRDLRKATNTESIPNGMTKRFAGAKDKLDRLKLGISTPEDLIDDIVMRNNLKEYYLLQAGELDGTLSLTNFRGTLIGNKRNTKTRVLNAPPTDKQVVFNPVTGRYHDARMYQPDPTILNNNFRLVKESPVLTAKDKKFIISFSNSLDNKMGVNERAAITDNLRILFTRYRKNPQAWGNFKAVSQAQIKFDVMNVSDSLETHLRADTDLLKKLLNDDYIDPVLGPIQLQSLHDDFIKNIRSKNSWEDRIAPKVAKELKSVFHTSIPLKLSARLSDDDLQQFYLRFAHKLSLDNLPDRDQLAVELGRDLYNLSNLNGSRREWYKTGMDLLEAKNVKKFFQVETFGVQKRRMKSRLSNNYFGPYYDTLSYNIRITDPRIQEYSKLTRKVELGLRVAVTGDENRLVFRKGYKTYFIKDRIGYTDTRMPITSTSSFSDFPEDFIDDKMVKALNWASKAKYKVDEDYYDFMDKLIKFKDDKGKAGFYDSLNEYRTYIKGRGDAYERFKTMEWLRNSKLSFSNHPFIDHRARIYERGLIGPQAGETFRPFLNTADSKILGVKGYDNLQDQVGAFLGGLDDYFEGRYNALTFPGRQKIAAKFRPELIKIGNHMIRNKPGDIRAILNSDIVSRIESEELGKFFRFAIEQAKIDSYLKTTTTKSFYSRKSLEALEKYKTALALEQDASSSGAQIIALTTKNKQLAHLSNVIPTHQKRRLYDEIAAATFNDPRFRSLNQKLGLTEKDLRKAAKAQNMVTFYGAGERTGILNVEGKLSKALPKDANVLVVKAAERDAVLEQISARMARVEKYNPELYGELKALRANVRDIFNKGINPGDDILEQLYFLEPKTKEFVEVLSGAYHKVVTPDDFKVIARIMSSHLEEQVPILKSFTKYFGRLSEDFLNGAKPSSSDFDWKSVIKTRLIGSREKGFVISEEAPLMSRILGIRANESVSEKFLNSFGFYDKNSTLDEIIRGVALPRDRATGKQLLGLSTTGIKDLPNVFDEGLRKTLATYLKMDILEEKDIFKLEILSANKLPKSWTNAPWVNFDGKIIEQNFTQRFEERLAYRDAKGNWVNNILQVPQKTEATWWEQVINKSGKINDIADTTKARTAYAVNGNHSNDAVIVKKFHEWGADANIQTATIHDAFFANAADMTKARVALRKIYADVLEKNIVKLTLDEMRARGLPKELYDKYLNEAIDTGIIPIPGRSRIGGKLLKDTDILKRSDILEEIPDNFFEDLGWYGVG